MRRILALMTFVISAWYLSKRWRGRGLQGRWQAMMLWLAKAGGGGGAPAMLGAMAVAARGRAEVVRVRATATARTVAGMARSASAVAVQKAEEVTSAAAQGAANLQQAPGTVADQAEQATRWATGNAPKAARQATGIAAEPAELAANVASAPVEPAAGGAPEPAERAGGAAAERAADPVPPSSIRTDVATPPAVHATVQAGLADRTERGGTREDDAAEEGSAPDAARPGPIAGTGTTTPADGMVHALSPVGGEPTSMGVPEPLPPELTPGEPGSGGPAGSSQAPSRPDSAETPTTGMEQPPVVDRMAEVTPRASGHFIGHKTTRLYHVGTSNHLPAEHNRVYFETQEEAIAAGFKPAENERLDSAGS
jgi:Metal binding domain of Ada